MNNFFDLQKFPQFQIKSSYALLITLLDELFGKDSYKQTIKIDNEAETDKNHASILNQWDAIHTLYKAPNNIKKTQKLVRQTLKHIVSYLNQTHQFTQPIKFINKRDAYRKNGKIITPTYVEFSLM